MSYKDLRQKTIEFLIQRKHAYFTWLVPILRGLHVPPPANMALADLARFCRANGDLVGTTDRETYILIGRRQVWLRIMQHRTMSPEELFDLYSQFRPPQENDE